MYDIQEGIKIQALRGKITNRDAWRNLGKWYLQQKRNQSDIEKAEICFWAVRYCGALDKRYEDETTVSEWLACYAANRLDMVAAGHDELKKIMVHINGPIAEALQQVVAEGVDRVKEELVRCVDELGKVRVQIL